MASRKNIWDLLENQVVDVPNEYFALWDLFHDDLIVKDMYGYSATFEKVVNDNFLHFKNRGSVTSYKGFLRLLKVKTPNTRVELEDLDLLIEVILFMLSELSNLRVRGIENGMKFVMGNISSILKKTNQKVISLEGKSEIVIPNDESVTIVSDLILPDNEKLALDVLGYSHYSKKDDIDEKRRILQLLANYLEPRLKKNKNTNISFLFNKYYIRHGGPENQNNIDNMSDTELNDLYDKLYREILYYILDDEHKEFEVMLTDMREEYGKK